MAEHDFHEFVGAVVAQIMLEMLVAPHIVGFAVVHRSDDVPGGAAVGHQIEGGEAARHVERFVIGGRAGRCQPELLGDHAHRGQHHDRIHLHAADAVFDGVGVIVAVTVRHRQAIVEERHVEFAGLPGSGRSPDNSPPTSNRRAIPDGATNSAGWCSSAPAGSPPTPFAVSCALPVPASVTSDRASCEAPAARSGTAPMCVKAIGLEFLVPKPAFPRVLAC